MSMADDTENSGFCRRGQTGIRQDFPLLCLGKPADRCSESGFVRCTAGQGRLRCRAFGVRQEYLARSGRRSAVAVGGGRALERQAVKLGPNNYLGMAFQQPGLFPWMTVRQNIAVGLTTRGIDKGEARRTADEMLGTVGFWGSRMRIPISCLGEWPSASESPVPSRSSRGCF